MAEPDDPQVPDGEAVFPLIPPELGVHPLLLAVLHALVFLEGSDDTVIDPAAADEAMQYVATYLQRLSGPRLQQVREDLTCLTAYARQEKWPKQEVRFLKEFLTEFGIQEEGKE